MNPEHHSNRYTILAAVATALLLLFGITDHEAWTPDEPRETLMSLDMARGSSWIVPQLADEPFVEKPPLYYWVVASAMQLLPEQINPAHVARGVSAACGALILAIVAWFAGGFAERRETLLAVAVLGTMTGFLELTHWIRIDSVLSVAVAGAALTGIAGIARGKPFLLVLAGFFTGLAFLAKGFVAVALIAPAIMAACWFNRDRLRQSWFGWPVGVIAMLAPPLLWIAAYRSEATPELWNEWFWINQVGRFLGKTRHLGHIHGPFYYVTALATVLLPWTFVLIEMLVFWKRYRDTQRDESFRRHWLPVLFWAIGGVLILSAAGTKRAIYLFPLLPAFALIVAAHVRHVTKALNYALMGIIGLLIVLSVFFSFAGWIPDGSGGALTFSPSLPTLALTICAIALLMVSFRFPLERTALVGAVIFMALIVRLEPILDHYKNYGPAFRQFEGTIPPEVRPRVCGWNLDQTTRASFPLYCGWRVVTIRDPERLVRILENRDPEFSQVIVQFEKKAALPSIELPPYETLIRQELATGRILGLIQAE